VIQDIWSRLASIYEEPTVEDVQIGTACYQQLLGKETSSSGDGMKPCAGTVARTWLGPDECRDKYVHRCVRR
jgi:hypothetical protein